MKLNRFLLPAAALALSGCAGNLQQQAASAISQADLSAHSAIDARRPASRLEIEAAQEVDRPYLFSRTAPVSREYLLPRALQKNEITGILFPTNWVSLTTAAQRIMAASGLVVTVAPDVYLERHALEPKSMASNALQGPSAVLLSGPALPGMPAAPQVEQAAAGAAPVSSASKSGIGAGRVESVHGFDMPRMEAPLSQILDLIATKLGIRWRYDERSNSIQFYRLRTRSWETPFSSALNTFDTTIDGGTSSSNNQLQVTSRAVMSPVKSSRAEDKDNVELETIKRSLDLVLTKSGQVYANPSTGTITVRDTEESLAAADEIIVAETRRLNRTVKLWFQTIQVTRNNSAERGVDLSAAINKALRNLPAFSINSKAPASMVGGNAGELSIGLFSGAAAGSEVIASALRQVGDVQTSTAIPLTTRNRRAVFINTRRPFTYVSATTAAAATTGGTGGTPGITTSQDEVGMKLVLLPTLSSKEQGDLVVSYDETVLNGPLQSFTTAGQTVQLLDKSGAGSVSQSVPIRNGQLILLSGLERTTDQVARRSLGEQLPWLLNGSATDSHTRSVTLVLVTVEMTDNE